MNKPIGGYFELELETKKEYYSNYYRFNLARNAIAYYFITKNIKTVHVPTFICESVINTLLKHNIRIIFYKIKNLLNPYFPQFNKKEGLLIVNHFGLHKEFNLNSFEYIENILIDNSHSFFNDNNLNSVFSPRKFFGTTDGAYLKSSKILDDYSVLPVFCALPYIEPLIRRIDNGVEEGFESYKKLQSLYSSAPIMKMSNFSMRILESIDYARVRKRREQNFNFFHKKLFHLNELNLDDRTSLFSYPLLIRNGQFLREKLILNKIFTPKYWQGVFENTHADKYDIDLVSNIIHLPIDQRYNKKDLSRIIDYLL
ncbi:MAG: hypothetical protein ACKO7P_04310 [Bacteroidota bacterium]